MKKTAIIPLLKQDDSTTGGEIHLNSNGTLSIVPKSNYMPRRECTLQEQIYTCSSAQLSTFNNSKAASVNSKHTLSQL